jgi:type 1 glutamine amidotransferase
MNYKKLFFLTALFLSIVLPSGAVIISGESFYKLKPVDAEAVYFTPAAFQITADGKTDVSDALQGAINKMKLEQNYGIIFIPEGTFKISRTIYIPAAIRIIGYGQKRPLFILKKNTPGYQTPVFKALVLTERGGQHEGFVVAALDWLKVYAADNNIGITVINHANDINEEFLADYKVIIQLNYPPYTWNEKAMAAFVKYIEEGRGGWVGFHHASLLGEFDGYPMWNWFSGFMGGIRFKGYIAETASGTVNVEDKKHPVMKGVSSSFVISDDEWYTFNKNPRPNVHVIATVDESTYKPTSDIKMGDHPVIWTNEKMKARNVYFLMGHDGSLLKSKDFTTMFSNAIKWASGKYN